MIRRHRPPDADGRNRLRRHRDEERPRNDRNSATNGWLDVAAVEGAGVMRVIDLTSRSLLSSRRLVPALTDWNSVEAPTIYALYPRRLRNTKTARLFLDFLTEIFAEIEKQRVPAYSGAVPRITQPHWFGRARGRQSAYRPNRS